jgi:hypothetical protein
MTTEDRVHWADIQERYTAALAIARKAWPDATPPAVIAQAAATLLAEYGRQVAPAHPSTPTTNGTIAPPPCPDCGGLTKPVTKTNPRMPDFRCIDRQCDAAVWTDRKKGGRR